MPPRVKKPSTGKVETLLINGSTSESDNEKSHENNNNISGANAATDENVLCLSTVVDCGAEADNKVMLREFSRSCRLPLNLFRFDETAISVSFVNKIWIRIEVPIVEFIDLGSSVMKDLTERAAALGSNNCKKSLHHHRIRTGSSGSRRRGEEENEDIDGKDNIDKYDAEIFI